MINFLLYIDPGSGSYLVQVIAAGARRVVIVSGLLKAADIVAYARTAKGLLNVQSEI